MRTGCVSLGRINFFRNWIWKLLVRQTLQSFFQYFRCFVRSLWQFLGQFLHILFIGQALFFRINLKRRDELLVEFRHSCPRFMIISIAHRGRFNVKNKVSLIHRSFCFAAEWMKRCETIIKKIYLFEICLMQKMQKSRYICMQNKEVYDLNPKAHKLNGWRDLFSKVSLARAQIQSVAVTQLYSAANGRNWLTWLNYNFIMRTILLSYCLAKRNWDILTVHKLKLKLITVASSVWDNQC